MFLLCGQLSLLASHLLLLLLLRCHCWVLLLLSEE